MRKKDFPLIILKELEIYLNKKGSGISILKSKDCLIHFIDNDSESNFHFVIEKFDKDPYSRFHFTISRSPVDHTNHQIRKDRLNLSETAKAFESWRNLLKEYEKVSFHLEDHYQKTFEEELYAEFEIIDEDADKSPFNLKQILLIDKYLEDLNKELEQSKTECNKEEIGKIQDEIIVIQQNLTQKNKKDIIKSLSKVLGKIARQGVHFLKDFLSESKKEVIKQIVKGALEISKEVTKDLLN